MTVTGLHHASLTVADLDRSLHFYRDLLGVPVREQVDAAAETFTAVSGEAAQHVRIADLDLGDGRVLELIENRDGNALAGSRRQPHRLPGGRHRRHPPAAA